MGIWSVVPALKRRTNGQLGVGSEQKGVYKAVAVIERVGALVDLRCWSSGQDNIGGAGVLFA